MKYKKFLLIPALLFFYLFFVVDVMVSLSPAQTTGTEEQASGGGVQPIGVGEAVSATVTRPYFFGLVMLPVYTSGIGYIGGYHDAFFWFLGLLTAAFVVMEWKGSVPDLRGHGKPSYKLSYSWEGRTMARMNMGGTDAMAILKIIGVGIAYGIVAWFMSVLFGDTGAITALMLLVMYLEYKLK